MLFFQFFCRRFQFGIPFFPEFAYERFTQELVNGQVFLLPQYDRCLAHVPTVVVYAFESAEVFHADGIEVAGNWFEKIRLACAACLLDGTKAAAFSAAASAWAKIFLPIL